MKFEVGEIAILAGLGEEDRQYNGEEVVIVSDYGLSLYDDGTKAQTYGISAPFLKHGSNVCIERLRKKKPPEELSNWEEIQKLTKWNPTKQGVTHE